MEYRFLYFDTEIKWKSSCASHFKNCWKKPLLGRISISQLEWRLEKKLLEVTLLYPFAKNAFGHFFPLYPLWNVTSQVIKRPSAWKKIKKVSRQINFIPLCKPIWPSAFQASGQGTDRFAMPKCKESLLHVNGPKWGNLLIGAVGIQEENQTGSFKLAKGGAWEALAPKWIAANKRMACVHERKENCHYLSGRDHLKGICIKNKLVALTVAC